MKNIRLLPALYISSMLIFGVAACQQLQDLAGGIGGPSDAEMNQLGAEAFEEIKANTPIERNAAMNNYVRCLANSLVNVIPHPNGQWPTGVTSWEVVVFRDNTANAFALPGGKIGVHTGLLPIAQTPSQLAAVMGHEVAHVILQHGKQRMVTAGYAQQAIGIGTEVIFGESENKESITGVLGAGAVYGVIMPFGRAHESEADILGQEYMAKAGFDPSEAVTLWMNMAQAAGGSRPPEMLSTHPAPETRIQDLKDNLPKTLPLFHAAGRNTTCRL